jgi:lamin tail-like protein
MIRRLQVWGLLLAAVSCAAVPAAWLDDSGLQGAGFGTVRFRTSDGHELTARVYRPRDFDPSRGPIWFVLHGASRDVERYVKAAAPVAERYGALVVAPHVTKEAYPKGSDYTLNESLYADVERLFDGVRGSLRGGQRGYYLFGHSAGAQFVHRLLTFLPRARALGAVAANAGWYTLPSRRDPLPYGLRGSSMEPRDLRGFFATPFVVLLGERDTATADTDELVRGTAEARAQGATRLDRGRFYFEAARDAARTSGAEFDWRLAVVPRAGHDAASMIASAGFLLFRPGEEPCTATPAAGAGGIVIRDVLADPPPGADGDVNGDGQRDPAEDELVEIVNTGKTSVCLAGWALGDVTNPERHVFPLGRALPPGGTLVVFGGGVPTGRFGGAEVQWSTAGLGLAKDGDVVTLRDRADAIVRQVSWGNCAGAPCAVDHRPLDETGTVPFFFQNRAARDSERKRGQSLGGIR